MTKLEELRIAVDRLDALQGSLGSVAAGGGANWRMNLVRARRALAEAIADISVVLDALEQTDAVASVGHDHVRATLSAFRSAVAMHQASYPVVAIEDKDATYHASSQQVRQAYQDFSRDLRRTYSLPASPDA